MDESGIDADKIQAQQLAEAERRLMTQYAARDNLSEDRVHQTFEEVAGRFAQARVRSFLPILIERAVRHELAEDRAETASAQPGPAEDRAETATAQPEPGAEQAQPEAEPSVNSAETARREVSQPADDERDGFGARIEKMLRVAEAEAADMRAEARREATEMLEQARAQAQAREHELNQSFVARQAELDERADRANHDLQAHQKAMTEELAAARRETERMRESAAAEAAAVLNKARDQARDVLHLAENAMQQHHDWVHGEVERLVGGRDGVRAELSRLREQLAKLPNDNMEADNDDASTGPGHGADDAQARPTGRTRSSW